jgi:hypothetical protein
MQLGGRPCDERKGMDAAAQLFGKYFINEPVARDARAAGEGGGHDTDLEMRLAARGGTGMAGMSCRLIDDLERERLKGGG